MVPPNPSRILLIRLSAVGDVVDTLPALVAIRTRFPRAHIGFVVEDRAHDLIGGHSSVDQVHLFPRRRWVGLLRQPLGWGRAWEEISTFVGEIRRQRYEVVLDFQANFKGALHALLSGVRCRVGFGPGHTKEWNHRFTNVHVIPPATAVHRVDKFLSLATALGASPDPAGYRLPEPPESRHRVGAFLARTGLDGYVATHPGTSDFGKAKRWRAERFSQLAGRIGLSWGLKSVVTWGPGERELAAEVAGGSRGHAVLALETRSVLDLAELIRRARLFVGCDSGPLHLSSAVGTPSVALFGPKDPRVYGPYHQVHRVVYKPSKGTGGSMDAILVEDALRAVEDLLGVPAEASRLR